MVHCRVSIDSKITYHDPVSCRFGITSLFLKTPLRFVHCRWTKLFMILTQTSLGIVLMFSLMIFFSTVIVQVLFSDSISLR